MTVSKLITVVGARPQFVKAFALSRALAAAADFKEVLVHTGQHFDENMSQVFFEELGLQKPNYHFSTEGGLGLGQMLLNIEKALSEERPDAVIVYGDTDSTLAGALAASKKGVPVLHIEAGMRAFNRRMPEETNRFVTDHLSTLLLCVTPTAMENLNREGLSDRSHLVGDLMYDATLLATEVAEKRSGILQRLSLQSKEYGVATVHRAANTDDPEMLSRVFDFIAQEARRQTIVLPLHPRTARAAASAGLDPHDTGATIVEPLGYFAMCKLVHHASIVLTDSGGLQKEAYFHRVPCVTMREETEWVETIESGWNRLWMEHGYRPRREIDDFGDGHSAERIVQHLRSSIGGRTRNRTRGAAA